MMTTTTDHEMTCDLARCDCDTLACDCEQCEICDEWTTEGVAEFGRHAGAFAYRKACGDCAHRIINA